MCWLKSKPSSIRYFFDKVVLNVCSLQEKYQHILGIKQWVDLHIQHESIWTAKTMEPFYTQPTPIQMGLFLSIVHQQPEDLLFFYKCLRNDNFDHATVANKLKSLKAKPIDETSASFFYMVLFTLVHYIEYYNIKREDIQDELTFYYPSNEDIEYLVDLPILTTICDASALYHKELPCDGPFKYRTFIHRTKKPTVDNSKCQAILKCMENVKIEHSVDRPSNDMIALYLAISQCDEARIAKCYRLMVSPAKCDNDMEGDLLQMVAEHTGTVKLNDLFFTLLMFIPYLRLNDSNIKIDEMYNAIQDRANGLYDVDNTTLLNRAISVNGAIDIYLHNVV